MEAPLFNWTLAGASDRCIALWVVGGAVKELKPYQTATRDDVQSQRMKSGVPIERDLEGHICPNCGSRRYCLVIRVTGGRYNGLLAARCSRCREPRMLLPDELIPQAMEQETEADRRRTKQ